MFVRPQQTFTINDRGLACLLTKIIAVGSPVNVNIVGILVTKVNNYKFSLVRITVGPDTFTTPEDKAAQLAQQKAFICNLKELGIEFTTQQVIQINNPYATTGLPGQYRKPLAALVCAGINIYSSYFGEPSAPAPLPNSNVPTVFFEVCPCQTEEALELLCQLDISKVDDPVEGLCINALNAEKVCKCAKNGNPCREDC